MSALSATAVTVAYGARRALDGVDLAVAPGGWTAVVGPNGSGKSTLLRALAGLVPAGGTIALGGRDVSTMRRRERARLVALVPQEPSLPEGMSVRRYVLLGRTPHLGAFGGVGESDRDACMRALERMDLEHAAERPVTELSGGEHQRAVLARALAQEASLLLLDEATSALDLRRQHEVLEAVDALRRERRLAVVSAMHDLTLAGQYVDRIMLLEEGRTVADGPAEAVLREDVLTRHYGVPVRVLVDGGERVVVPLRPGVVR